MLTLPTVLRSHPIEDVLLKLEAVLRGEQAPKEVLDAIAELRHLREHNPRCVDLATKERDRRVVAETERDLAVAELGLVRRAWVLMGLPGSPAETTRASDAG